MTAYLAAPFFSERELGIIKATERAMAVLGIDYFSPRKGDNNDLPPAEKYSLANARKIFDMDIREMKAAHVCIASLDGTPYFNDERNKATFARDQGTAFEMGFFFGTGKPIIGYTELPSKSNLMIANACDLYFPTRVAMEIALATMRKKWLPNGNQDSWWWYEAITWMQIQGFGVAQESSE